MYATVRAIDTNERVKVYDWRECSELTKRLYTDYVVLVFSFMDQAHPAMPEWLICALRKSAFY